MCPCSHISPAHALALWALERSWVWALESKLMGPVLAVVFAPGLQVWTSSASSTWHTQEALVMGMANLHPSCPSSLLLLLAGAEPSCRPAPLGESLEKGDSSATLTQLPPLNRVTWLSQGYVGPSPQE